MSALSAEALREIKHLAERARALYGAFIALPPADVEHRCSVWSEIVAIQLRVDDLLGPAMDKR